MYYSVINICMFIRLFVYHPGRTGTGTAWSHKFWTTFLTVALSLVALSGLSVKVRRWAQDRTGYMCVYIIGVVL